MLPVFAGGIVAPAMTPNQSLQRTRRKRRDAELQRWALRTRGQLP